MKILKVPEYLLKVIPYMSLGDKFWMLNGDEYKFITRVTIQKPLKMEVFTFECNGKDFKCNVWDNCEVFYIQEI